MEARSVGKRVETSKPAEQIYKAFEVFFIALAVMLSLAGLMFVPQAIEAQRMAEIERLQDVALENAMICERWGLKRGTSEHSACTLDLDALRASQDRATTARLTGFF